jgi:4-hydroxythreonine-4-phosphate dehydrogenase
MVTGPIAKSRLAEIGFTHPGQTEFVADCLRRAPRDAVMMLAGPSLRTVPLTVHVALADVPRLLTAADRAQGARSSPRALIRDFGIERPRLAIAALNPHAGEDGRFGDEDSADHRTRHRRLAADRASTPPARIPADALFAPHARGGL